MNYFVMQKIFKNKKITYLTILVVVIISLIVSFIIFRHQGQQAEAATWFSEQWYVYVLQSKKDGKLYTGCTNDLKVRLKKHNKGKVNSTKDRKPLILIYYEACLSKYDTYKRERYLKSGYGKNYLKNRLKDYYVSGEARAVSNPVKRDTVRPEERI